MVAENRGVIPAAARAARSYTDNQRGHETPVTTYHLHLVSDATGETVNSVARACLVQFAGVEPIEHVWTLIRTKGQMTKVLDGITENPGAVLFTIVNDELRGILIRGCQSLGVPYIPVLDPIIYGLAAYFDVEISGRPGLQHALNAELFRPYRGDELHPCP